MAPKFIADVMVGKLARWLRILGYDVAYSNAYTDDEILRIASDDSRIILTRDTGLSNRAGRLSCVLIDADDCEKQVRQVLDTYSLRDAAPFTRCLNCNHFLEDIDKESVFERIPPYVYLTQDRFAVCPSCNQLYWHGTHTENIEEQITRWFPKL
jgi:uncharacterized protein with PIN domain